MAKKRARVPAMKKLPNAKLEQRMMVRGAGGALAGLKQEAAQRAEDGKPMSKLEMVEREAEIVQRAHDLYRFRTQQLTGETVVLKELE